MDQKEYVTRRRAIKSDKDNGAITQQKKPRGKQRTIHKLTTLSFSTKEGICTYSVKGNALQFLKNKEKNLNIEQPSPNLEQSRFPQKSIVETRVENNLKRRFTTIL